MTHFSEDENVRIELQNDYYQHIYWIEIHVLFTLIKKEKKVTPLQIIIT